MHRLHEILKEIGSVRWHWRANFKRGRRSGKKLIDIRQPLNRVLIDTWIQNPAKYPHTWRRFFKLEFHPDSKARGQMFFHQYYVFKNPHIFELKVEPHWITHVEVINPTVMARSQTVQRWLLVNTGSVRRTQEPVNERVWTKYDLTELAAKRDLERLRKQGFEEAEMRLREMQVHFSFFCKNIFSFRGVTVARLASNQRVAGASPAGSTF